MHRELSESELKVFDLEVKLEGAKKSFAKLVAMHAEVANELCWLKDASTNVELKFVALKDEKVSLSVALREARDEAAENLSGMEKFLTWIRVLEAEQKDTWKKFHDLKKRHHHYKAKA